MTAKTTKTTKTANREHATPRTGTTGRYVPPDGNGRRLTPGKRETGRVDGPRRGEVVVR